MRIPDLGACIPSCRVAYSAKPIARRLMRIKHLPNRRTKREICKADDPRTSPGVAVLTACGHGGDPIDELGLSHRLEFLVTIRAIHAHAFDEDGTHHVVPAAYIRKQLIEEIATVRMIPEMVVRITDRPCRLDNLFLHERQPVFVANSHDQYFSITWRAKSEKFFRAQAIGGNSVTSLRPALSCPADLR